MANAVIKLGGTPKNSSKASLKDVANLISQTILHPIKTVSDVITLGGKSAAKKASVDVSGKSGADIVGEGVIAALGYTSIIAGVGGIAAKGAAATAKALIPATTKVKVAGAAAALLATGAIVQEPLATAKAVASLPAGVVNVGGNVAQFAASPSLYTAKNIITENPLIASGLAAAGLLAVGGGIGTAAASLINTSATRQNTAALQTSNAGVLVPTETVGTPSAGGLISPTLPITPETVSMEPTTAAKTSAGSSTTKNNQRVDIFINQINKSVRYKNRHYH